jgi:hypothetical protein
MNSFNGMVTGYPNGITPSNIPVGTQFNAAQFGRTQRAVQAFPSPSVSGMRTKSSDEQQIAPPRGAPTAKKRSVASLGPPNRTTSGAGTVGQVTALPVVPTVPSAHPVLTHSDGKTRLSTTLPTSIRSGDIRSATVLTSNAVGYTQQASSGLNGDRNPTNTNIPGSLTTTQPTKELERTSDNPEQIGRQHT